MDGTEVRRCSSTSRAPRAPSASPAAAASEVSGRTPAASRTRSAGTWESVRQARGDGAAARVPQCGDRRAQPHLDAGAEQFPFDAARHLRVQGRHDLPGQFDERDRQAAVPQRLGRLQADEPGPNDHCPAGAAVHQLPQDVQRFPGGTPSRACRTCCPQPVQVIFLQWSQTAGLHMGAPNARAMTPSIPPGVLRYGVGGCDSAHAPVRAR